MSTRDTDPSQGFLDEVPQADAAEQETPVVPDEDEGESDLQDAAAGADEADVWEQAQTVANGEDDYDRDAN